MYFPLNMGILHCYVSLPEGRYIIPGWKRKSTSSELTADFSRFVVSAQQDRQEQAKFSSKGAQNAP